MLRSPSFLIATIVGFCLARFEIGPEMWQFWAVIVLTFMLGVIENRNKVRS